MDEVSPNVVQPVHWVQVERRNLSMEEVMSIKLPGVRSNIFQDAGAGTITHLKVTDAFEHHLQDKSHMLDADKLQAALLEWKADLAAEGIADQLVTNYGNNVTYALLSDNEALIATLDRRCEIAIPEWQNVVFNFYAAACEGRKTAKPWFFEQSHPLMPHQRFFHKPLRNKPSPLQLERLRRSAHALPAEDVARYGHQCDKSDFVWEGGKHADPAWSHIRESWPYLLDMMSVNGYDVDDSQHDAFHYLHCLNPDCQYQYAMSLLEKNDDVEARDTDSSMLVDGASRVAPAATKTAIVYVLKSMTQSASTGVEAIKSIANFMTSAGVARVHVVSVLPFSTKVSAEVASRKSTVDIILWPVAHHKFEWFNHSYNVPMAGIESSEPSSEALATACDDDAEGEPMHATPKPADDSHTVRNFLHHAVLASVFRKRTPLATEQGGAHRPSSATSLEREALGHLFDSKYALPKQNLEGPVCKRLELKQDDVLHLQKRYPKTFKVMRRVVKLASAK